MKRVICAVLFVAACGGGNSGSGGGGDDDPTQPDAGMNGGATCGDAIVDGTEECDDGNTDSDDGCAADCTLEASGGACSPYSFRCNPSGDVETCNNAGTAWLVVENCATGCSGGVCTDATCTPGATRCHGNAVEVCDGGGTSWSAPTACPTYCAAGQCALQALDVTTNSNYTGTVIVAGDFTVGNNSTLTAEDGDLTIIAENIHVAQGASIAVAPTGENTKGQSCVYSYYGRQANYGQVPTSYMVAAYGSEDDADVEPGSVGGRQNSYACSYPSSPITGHGGGVIRLIARKNVTIAGQILAAGQNGQPYGGSGGGVQIAGDTITITGSISTAGGNSSGYGRVRLLYGSTLTNTGTIIGTVTEGRRPPLELTSPTHPNPALHYNDAFAKLTVAHERPFSTAQGYLHTIDTDEFAPPQPAEGVFAGVETFDIEASKLEPGDNWVHLASLDASSALGEVESRFQVRINDQAPYAESTSHTSPTTWYMNANPYFAWTNPNDLEDASFPKVRYVLDHFGDTVPTKTDTALPISQKQLLVSNLANGIWVFHVLTEDTVGNLTKNAAHVVVRIGPDPGVGTVFGSVFNAQNQPVSGAKVRVNRGLFTATTNSSGSYTINGVAAGAWEISVVAPTGTAAPQQLTVNKDGMSSANFTLN